MTAREDKFRCDWKSWCVRIDGHDGDCEPATPSRLYEPSTPLDHALILALHCGRCQAQPRVGCVGSITGFHLARFILANIVPLARLDAPTPLTPGEPPALIPCRICGKDGYCGTHNDRNSDDPDEEDTLPPGPPAKCKTCGGTGKYVRPSPSTTFGPALNCPECTPRTPSLPREPEATPIIVHAFMNRKEPLCEHDYSMFRENESVVSTDSLAVNCKTCLEIRDVAREPEAKVCEPWCSGETEPPGGLHAWLRNGRWYCTGQCFDAQRPLNPRAR